MNPDLKLLGVNIPAAVRSVPVSVLIAEEVGTCCPGGGVCDKKVPQRDGILDGELEREPADSLVSDPQPDSPIAKGFDHD